MEKPKASAWLHVYLLASYSVAQFIGFKLFRHIAKLRLISVQMNYEWLWKRFYVIVVKTGSSMKRLWLQLQSKSLSNGWTLILPLTHQSSFKLLVLNFLVGSLAYPCDENLSTFVVTVNAFSDLIFGEESRSSWLVLFWCIFIRLFLFKTANVWMSHYCVCKNFLSLLFLWGRVKNTVLES